METTSVNTGLTFGEPLWLWALLLVPALAGLFWWAQTRRSALIARIVAPRLREQLASGVNLAMRWVKVGLVLLAIALTIVALAKPRMGFVQREIKTKGRDVLLAIDTSRSMLATDVTPTRLARAKLVSQDLMRLLRGDRVGLIAFAGSAFLQAPLTLDYNAVLTTLDELDTDVIPRGGSNLAAAIQTAIDAFGKAEGVMRALVILTDGEELDADGVAAAKRAGEAGIRIFTIGLGSTEGALIPIRTPDGRQDFVRDSAGQPVNSKLDATRLAEIAEATGGFFSELTPDVARDIFQRGIEPLAEQETGMMASRQPIEQYEWPLGAALVCLMLWILLGEGRRSRRPLGSRTAKTVVARLAIGGIALGLISTGRAADGMESYAKGDYEAAIEDFERQSESLPGSEKLEFNAGAAAYQAGDFAKAVDFFTDALLTEDAQLRESAAYNLGNALTRRGEAAKSVESKKADWKDAIAHYSAALEANPDNFEAEDNRSIVEKMLEDLEKEQQKQQEQDKQDQKNDPEDQKDQEQKENQEKDDQQDQKDQQQQDDQKKDGEGEDEPQDQKDQENGDEGEKGDEQKDEESGDEESNPDQQDGEGEDQKADDQEQEDGEGDQQQDQDSPEQGDESQGQNDAGSQPTPAPTPGEKKEGELQSGADQQTENEQPSEGAEPAGEGEEVDGEMSEAQARNLLRSMQGDEERVRMMERRDFQNVMRDW